MPFLILELEIVFSELSASLALGQALSVPGVCWRAIG